MFKATKPFQDAITDHPQQPSLRIGHVVPKEAVNLAYYYNPTATDVEKILTAEAPRNTIDHRIEQAYRYLFDQASDDDDLFPEYVTYEDEEGYTGKLGRMYTQWIPKTHLLTKHISDVTDTVIVVDKSELPKTKEYSDLDGYKGTLFLDVSTVGVSKTRDDTAYEHRDREILNFELVYHDIFDKYIPQGPSNAVDRWMLGPNEDSSSQWPKKIEVSLDGCTAVDCRNTTVRAYVNNLSNTLDGAIGTLEFIRTEYEPVAGDSSEDDFGSSEPDTITFGNAVFRTKKVRYVGDIEDGSEAATQFVQREADKADNLFKEFYGAEYNASTGKYSYYKVPANYSSPSGSDFADKLADQKSGSINEFINTIVRNYCTNKNATAINKIKDAMEDRDRDIAIYRTSLKHVITDSTQLDSYMYFEATYECKISSPRPKAGQYAYNVIAVYGGTLTKTVVHQVQVATEYEAICHYSGIARKTWETYNGMAYYRGSVTKGNSVGNMNPEEDNEVLMFPDIHGYLRRPVYVTDDNGNVTLKNFYKLETNYAYLTDVFKNGTACFWKYDLKAPLYDYRGPDSRGFYEGNAVKIFTSALKDLPVGYEYNIKLIPAEYTTVSQINSSFVPQLVKVPMRYHAELFTSFLSTAADTYKATYNAFDDNDKDNIALNNGVTEEIYNYPFMIQNRDFTIESISKAERTSRIKMRNDYENYIEDTRYYVTFTYKVIAERKQQYGNDDQSQELIKAARKIESYPITVSILNRDYALPIEYNKFDGRGMIISPQSDGIYKSPFDIILATQSGHPPLPQDVDGNYIGKMFAFDGTIILYDENYKYEQQKVYRNIGVDSTGDPIYELIGRYEEYEGSQEVFITSRDTDFYFYTQIINYKDSDRGGINIKCNPDGSGYITAETTIDTGFWNPVKENWTGKLSIDNPYFIEQCQLTKTDKDGHEYTTNQLCIFPGIKVKCIDARHIKVLAPREDALLDSWYPRLQFGHYSQILDQYGTHTKVCYTMPEYDTQYFSTRYLAPYVDVVKEKVEILNSHMVRTKCFPLRQSEISLDSDSYLYKDTVYRVYKKKMTWQKAKEFCESIGGTLAMPYNNEISNFISDIASKYSEATVGLWIGATDEGQEGQWKWIDGTPMTFSNWSFGEPNNSDGIEHYLEIYTQSPCQWNDLSGNAELDGFICEFKRLNSIKLHKQVGDVFYPIHIRDVSFSEGIIITDTTISENDKIVCDYTYLEESYVYRGFWKTERDFARIDLNPNIYHTYSDLTYSPTATKPTKNLFNKVIYFFMRPSIVFEIISQDQDDLIFDFDNPEYNPDDVKVIAQNKECLYHKIDDNMPDKTWDVYIGSVYIRQNTSLHSTIIVDGRTRGGGVIESMKDTIRKQLEPESDYYLDIGFYDGEPYQENGVIIVRLDQRLLKDFGGRFTKGDIETKVKRWLGYGVYPIIEYVDTYTKHDMPQHSLIVEDSYGNVIDITPEIYLEYINDL